MLQCPEVRYLDYLAIPIASLRKNTGAVGARDASLTIMVGGSKGAFERSQQVLQLIGKRVLHCGELGAGLAAKLAKVSSQIHEEKTSK